MEEKIDALYIFSDFEDFVDEDIAAEIGQKLGRRKIRTYVQPAEKTTEFLRRDDERISEQDPRSSDALARLAPTRFRGNRSDFADAAETSG